MTITLSKDAILVKNGAWQPTFVESGQLVAENLTMHSRRPGNEVRSLAVLAREYIDRLRVRHFLGLMDDGRDISYVRLSQATLEPEEVTDGPYERYCNAMQKLGPIAHRDLIQEIERAVQEMMENVRQSATVTAAAVTNIDDEPSSVNSPISELGQGSGAENNRNSILVSPADRRQPIVALLVAVEESKYSAISMSAGPCYPLITKNFNS